MKKRDKILFVAQNPGGFNAICPVIKKIDNSKFEYQVFLADDSCQIAEDEKIKFIDCSGFSDKKIESLAKDFDPSICLLGTSEGLSIDKKIIFWTSQNNIPTVSVIDFWSNYKMRFSDPETNNLKYLTDAICVVDEVMRREIIEEGFDKNILHITGNPFFNTWSNIKTSDKKYIVFISQPFSEINNKNFNEIKIFEDFAEVLEKLEIKLPIYISFHPRSKKRDKFDSVIKKSQLNINKTSKKSEELIKNAKLVIGINSMVLFQASLLGKAVISYQPGINSNKDCLVSNKLKLSKPVYNYNDLSKEIKKNLKKNSIKNNLKKAREKYIKNNSIERVMKVINKYL